MPMPRIFFAFFEPQVSQMDEQPLTPTTPTTHNGMSINNMLNESEQINQDEQIVLAALGAIKSILKLTSATFFPESL